MTPDEIRGRLLSEEAVAELATALVDDALAVPLRELLSPPALANEIVEALRAWLNSTPAHELQLAWAARARKWLASQRATLGQLVGRAIEEACLDLAASPHVPRRETVIFLLDREPLRALLRELLVDALVAFGRKVGAPVMASPVGRRLGGLGSFVRERARGTALAAFATDVADRLADEVERQIERRAAEFADAALSGLVARLADILSDPARAGQLASAREALVDGLFSLEARELADELERSDPARRSTLIRRGLGAWVATDEAAVWIRAAIEGLLDEIGDRPLGEVLAELELLESFRGIALASTSRRLRRFLEGEAFQAWLERRLAAQTAA